MRHILTPLLVLIPLVACAVDNTPGAAAVERISMARSTGAVQCSGGGLTLEDTERELADAGVQVLSASCGHDGRMHPMMCGRSDGSLHIVEIPASQAAAAAALKFVPLSRLPEARRSPCGG